MRWRWPSRHAGGWRTGDGDAPGDPPILELVELDDDGRPIEQLAGVERRSPPELPYSGSDDPAGLAGVWEAFRRA